MRSIHRFGDSYFDVPGGHHAQPTSLEPGWGHRVGVYAIGGCPFGEGLMLFPGPPFWLHIVWFCASWQTLRSLLQVSIYYEMGIELERYTYLLEHTFRGACSIVSCSLKPKKKPKRNI